MIKARFSKIRKDIRDYVALAKNLKDDTRVPRISRVLITAAVAYFFMPIDIIPDFIPVLGQVDDAIIVPFLIILALMFIPKKISSEHYKRIFRK